MRVPEAAVPTPPTPTLIQRTPIQPAPTQRMPVQPAPVQSAPVQQAPIRPTPVQSAPEAMAAPPPLGVETPGADAWQQNLLAQMDNLLLGRPGPNLLPPEPAAPPVPLGTPAATDLSGFSAPEIAQRQPAHFDTPSAVPPRIKGTALEQELLAQVDRLLLGRPGPNADFLALAAQTPLRAPDQAPHQIPSQMSDQIPNQIPDQPRPIAPAAEASPAWEVAPEPLPAPEPPIRPVPAPRTQVQQQDTEPARKPTFEVTIGRLEVIAPPPQIQQQQQPRRLAPKTSLQDYLDRRRVGR